MAHYGPIIFIDDDPDDRYIYESLVHQIAPHYQTLFFSSGQQAIDFLMSTDTKPFLIFSEVAMHTMNGLELRRQIESDPVLRKRSIPFIFLTHPVYRHQVEEAYDLTIQGFFEKQTNMDRLRTQLEAILTYWSNCLHPNRFVDGD